MSNRRLQVNLDHNDSTLLSTLEHQLKLGESDAIRAAIRFAVDSLAEPGDESRLQPYSFEAWPWPKWWYPLAEELESMRERGKPIRTRTGVKNTILQVNKYEGWVLLKSARSRSGEARCISVAMIENVSSTHGAIRQVLHDMAVRKFKPSVKDPAWHGPFTVRTLLERCMDDHDWPPEDLGVYLVSKHPWKDSKPTPDCEPLYLGSTTGRSPRFCTRVGDLIIDMHGFFGTYTGHSSGGIHLYNWCSEHEIHPGDLYISWYTHEDMCLRCSETRLYHALRPKLNKISPPGCKGDCSNG